MVETSPTSTPKRKRAELVSEARNSSQGGLSLNRALFSFMVPGSGIRNDIVEDGNSSPRSKVAQKFRDLALEADGGVAGSGDVGDCQTQAQGGGGVTTHTEPGGATTESQSSHAENHGTALQQHNEIKETGHSAPKMQVFDFDGNGVNEAGEDMQIDDDDVTARKRIKLPDHDTASGLDVITDGQDSADAVDTVKQDESGHIVLESAVEPKAFRIVKGGGQGRLQKSYPSINRLSDSKSLSRKRAGTPPLTARRRSTGSTGNDELPVIVDPVRAALTWHEDEITIYDPDDKDDDGTGINGIGFKPSAAVAFQRAQKRRQQLADYKKREESDARAKRNQRRREQFGVSPELERKHSIVRVHFSDTEPSAVAIT